MGQNWLTPPNWNLVRNEMENAFRDGTVSQAEPEQLEKWLQCICLGEVPAIPKFQHCDLLRGITINHIQMARTIRTLEDTIRSLDMANARTQKLVVRLTWVAVAVGVIQAVAAIVSLFRK